MKWIQSFDQLTIEPINEMTHTEPWALCPTARAGKRQLRPRQDDSGRKTTTHFILHGLVDLAEFFLAFHNIKIKNDIYNNLNMEITEKYTSQVSDDLLSFLSEELGDTKIGYEIPPSQLQGGYDTSVFQFKLKNVHSFLSGPLVLRVFRKSHPPKQAIMERVIHNSLVDQGFTVPTVYYACVDDKYLDAYRGERDLNEQHLGYYQVFFSALRLFIGTKEVAVWAQLPIRYELINIIYDLSKIQVEVPRP